MSARRRIFVLLEIIIRLVIIDIVYFGFQPISSFDLLAIRLVPQFKGKVLRKRGSQKPQPPNPLAYVSALGVWLIARS